MAKLMHAFLDFSLRTHPKFRFPNPVFRWHQTARLLSDKYSLFLYIYFADRASQYIYLNINQLDALNFIMSLFHASTCFEHMCSSSGGQKLYYTASGIITPVGGRPVHRLREDCARDGHLQV